MDGKYVIKTPADAIDSKTEGPLRTDLYIPPYGPNQINEIRDYTASESGTTVNYHYSDQGAETFTVMKGRVQVVMNGKRFILEEGDIFNVEAWCPCSMTFLEADTVVREMCTNRNNKEYDLPDPADRVDTDKETVPEVAVKGKGIYEFGVEGIALALKVGRWQLGGLKEVWECRVGKGYRLEFSDRSDNEGLYMIRSGRFKVEVDGKGFAAGADDGDLIHIPANTAYSLTALSDDCVVQDFNVSCHLFRLLEMIEAARDYFPEKLKERAYIDYLFEANKLVKYKSFSKVDIA